jgi:hypothetical protein
MVLEKIFTHPPSYWHEHGISITMTDLRFMRFVGKEIFPGGQMPSAEDVVEFSSSAGFSMGELQVMNEHYVRTLDTWAANLEARRDDATAATSNEIEACIREHRRNPQPSYLAAAADWAWRLHRARDWSAAERDAAGLEFPLNGCARGGVDPRVKRPIGDVSIADGRLNPEYFGDSYRYPRLAKGPDSGSHKRRIGGETETLPRPIR